MSETHIRLYAEKCEVLPKCWQVVALINDRPSHLIASCLSKEEARCVINATERTASALGAVVIA